MIALVSVRRIINAMASCLGMTPLLTSTHTGTMREAKRNLNGTFAFVKNHPEIGKRFGKTQSAAMWSRETGLKRQTILNRLLRRWTIEDALTKPLHNG